MSVRKATANTAQPAMSAVSTTSKARRFCQRYGHQVADVVVGSPIHAGRATHASSAGRPISHEAITARKRRRRRLSDAAGYRSSAHAVSVIGRYSNTCA
jgi:hypothetical protein